MNDHWESFKTSKPEFNLLSEGEHNLRVIRYENVNSFLQYNGNPKDELPAYRNPCPQLAITVVAADEGKSGGLTFRMNRIGFVKYDELTEKQIKSGKYENVAGWACLKDSDDDLVREEDADKTKACENIINQFAAALAIPEGSNLLEAMDASIESKAVFRGTVTNEPYEGRDQLRLGRFRSAVAVAAEADFEE